MNSDKLEKSESVTSTIKDVEEASQDAVEEGEQLNIDIPKAAAVVLDPSDSDLPSSEPLLSEGEVVDSYRDDVGKSDGELSLGLSKSQDHHFASTTFDQRYKPRAKQADNSCEKVDLDKKGVSRPGESILNSSSGGEMREGVVARTDPGGAGGNSSGVGEYLADLSASDGETGLRVAKRKSTLSSSNR